MQRASLLLICVLLGVDAARRPGRRLRGERTEDTYDENSGEPGRAIPGEPGVDYPNYAVVPYTAFSCRGKSEGFYADLDARCQVFHICSGSPASMTKQSFLCPNGTVFNSKVNTCEWWNKVYCNTGNTDEERYQAIPISLEQEPLRTPAPVSRSRVITSASRNRPNTRGLRRGQQIYNENKYDKNTEDLNSRFTTPRNLLDRERTTESLFSYNPPFNDKYTGSKDESFDFRNSKYGSLSEKRFRNRPLTTNTLPTDQPPINAFSNKYSSSTFPPKGPVREVTIKPRLRYNTEPVRQTTHNPLYSLNPIIHVARDSSLLSNFKNSQEFTERYLEGIVTTDSPKTLRVPIQRYVVDGVLDQYKNSLDGQITSLTSSNEGPLQNNKENSDGIVPEISRQEGDGEMSYMVRPGILGGEIDTSSNFRDTNLNVNNQPIQTPITDNNEENRGTFSKERNGNKQQNNLVRFNTNRKYLTPQSSYSYEEDGPSTIRVSSGYSFQSANEQSKYLDRPKQLKVVSSYSVEDQFVPTEIPIGISDITENPTGNYDQRKINNYSSATPLNYPLKEDRKQYLNRFEVPKYDESSRDYVPPAHHMINHGIKTYGNEYSTTGNTQENFKEISQIQPEINLLPDPAGTNSNLENKGDKNNKLDSINDHNSITSNDESTTQRKIEYINRFVVTESDLLTTKNEFTTVPVARPVTDEEHYQDHRKTNPTHLNKDLTDNGVIQFLNRFVVQESDISSNTPSTKVQNKACVQSSINIPPHISSCIDTLTDQELNTYFPGIVREDTGNKVASTTQPTASDVSRQSVHQDLLLNYLPTSKEPGLIPTSTTPAQMHEINKDSQPTTPDNFDIDIRIDRVNNNNETSKHRSMQPFVINVPHSNNGLSQFSNDITLSSPPSPTSVLNHQSLTPISGHFITEAPPQIVPFRFRMRTQNQRYEENRLPSEFNNRPSNKEEEQILTRIELQSSTVPPLLSTLTGYSDSKSIPPGNNYNTDGSLSTTKHQSPTPPSVLRNSPDIVVDKSVALEYYDALYNMPSDQTLDNQQFNSQIKLSSSSTETPIFKTSTNADKPSSLFNFENKYYSHPTEQTHSSEQYNYEHNEQQGVTTTRTQSPPYHPVSTVMPYSISGISTSSNKDKFTRTYTEEYVNGFGFQSPNQRPSTIPSDDVTSTPKVEMFDIGSLQSTPIQNSFSSKTSFDAYTERHVKPSSSTTEGGENRPNSDQNAPYMSSTYVPETTKKSFFNTQGNTRNSNPAFENSHVLLSDFPPQTAFYSLYPNYRIHPTLQALSGLSVPANQPSSTPLPIQVTAKPPSENIDYETTTISYQSSASHVGSSDKPSTTLSPNSDLSRPTINILPSLETYSTTTTEPAVSQYSSSNGVPYSSTPSTLQGNNVPPANVTSSDETELHNFKTTVAQTPQTKVSFSTPTPFFGYGQGYFHTEPPVDYTQIGKQLFNFFDLFNINSLAKPTYSSPTKEESSPDIVKAISFSLDTPEDQKVFEIARSKGLLDN